MNKTTANVILGVGIMLVSGFSLYWTNDMKSLIPLVLLAPYAFDLDFKSDDDGKVT